MSIQLASDVEIGLRAKPAAHGMEVDVLIGKAVRAYLREPPVPTSRQVNFRDRSTEMAWAARPDLQFVGKWVVLEGAEVVASDSDAKRLYEDVRAKGAYCSVKFSDEVAGF